MEYSLANDLTNTNLKGKATSIKYVSELKDLDKVDQHWIISQQINDEV